MKMTKIQEAASDIPNGGGDLAWTKLLDEPNSPNSTIIKIDEQVKEDTNPAIIKDEEPPRRESLLGSFHRHLRMSLKAVSESSGPFTR